ncbi:MULTISPECIES: hypothetical protein [Nonomuraea]|uniref:Nucleic acid-binding Zn ribbon protein n=1 Tax=Nonomuraea thailandensis TaxID=1188745 RepID=A0A9X2GRA6_9ACTN|nr:hypothetical protein [Nonomuraea thailandensis]MCP2360271.1 putative nucleic acid-binding Zn ribbon protein [Nonomuraea thailandensis]
MDKRLELLQRLLDANGGKVNGKFLIAVIVVALIVVVGFLAFRLILVDMILSLRDAR